MAAENIYYNFLNSKIMSFYFKMKQFLGMLTRLNENDFNLKTIAMKDKKLSSNNHKKICNVALQISNLAIFD
jgi:hypothetical protein